MSATAGPDLVAHDYTLRPSTPPAATSAGAPPTGDAPPADFTTCVVVRRPAHPERFSGTLVVEWLNVSSGARRPGRVHLYRPRTRPGRTRVGGHLGAIHRAGAAPGRCSSMSQRGTGPGRPGALRRHEPPGDAYCYDIFGAIAAALRGPGGPLADLRVERVLAVGESQSSMALTTYVTEFAEGDDAIDGYLVHSRPLARRRSRRSGAPADITLAYEGGPSASVSPPSPPSSSCRPRPSCSPTSVLPGARARQRAPAGPGRSPARHTPTSCRSDRSRNISASRSREPRAAVVRPARRTAPPGCVVARWSRAAQYTAAELIEHPDAEPTLQLDDVGNAVGGVHALCRGTHGTDRRRRESGVADPSALRRDKADSLTRRWRPDTGLPRAT